MKTHVKMNLFKYISMQISVLEYSGICLNTTRGVKSVQLCIDVLLRIATLVFVFIVPVGGQIIYLIELILDKGEIQEVAATINLVLTELLTFVKLLDLWLRRHLLMQLSKQINNKELNLVPKEYFQNLQKSIIISRRLFIWFVFVTFFDVFVHVIVVPAFNGFRTLPVKMRFIIFNVNDYFRCVLAYQILYKPLMVLTFDVVESLPWAFMLCAIGQLDVLIYNFENMKELVKAEKSETKCDENEAFKSIFKKCLRHHFAIKRLVYTMEEVFSGQFLLTLIFNACIIGTTAVQIFSIEAPLDHIVELSWVLLFLMVFILMLFMDCILSNHITIKSGYISTAAYNGPWINLSTELKKSLLIFIAETQHPLVIRTGRRLVPVSLETFTKVMNWTYNGFALLNQMKN